MATKWHNLDGNWQPWRWLLACDLSGLDAEVRADGLGVWQVEPEGVVCYTDAEADAAGLALDGVGVVYARKAVALTAEEQAEFARLSGAKGEVDKQAAANLVAVVADKATRDALNAVLGISVAALDAAKEVGS